jgi:CMP/dCMP kinase
VSERVIAIDGPAGAGKSTVAKKVAAATGLPYLDTGAMYRCVAFAAVRDGVDIKNQDLVGEIAMRSHIVIEKDSAMIDGQDVSDVIRGYEVTSVVSVIAAHTPVRTAMREQQRAWIRDHGGGVVEGRDIGTVVFPDALLKVFLTASPEVRARRRVSQTGGDVEEIARAIAERDHLDSSREDSPLHPHKDSMIVDSSNQSIEEVVATIAKEFFSRDSVTNEKQRNHG